MFFYKLTFRKLNKVSKIRETYYSNTFVSKIEYCLKMSASCMEDLKILVLTICINFFALLSPLSVDGCVVSRKGKINIFFEFVFSKEEKFATKLHLNTANRQESH